MSFKSLQTLAALALAASLAACGGGDSDPAPSSSTPSPTTFCGHQTGPNQITGTVTSVHDGDTLTVSGTTVRLASIDAPELAQPYGNEAQAALAAKVLGQTVTVAYANADRYGRVVGSVFTPTCDLVNLRQVQEGAAWVYEAYRCEVSAADRDAYAKAQDEAQLAKRGLWAKDEAQAPWNFRNGTDPATPTCSSDAPVWPATGSQLLDFTNSPPATETPPVTPTPPAPSPTPPAPTPGYVPPPSTACHLVWVSGYTRADGTRVRGHYRRSPGCA